MRDEASEGRLARGLTLALSALATASVELAIAEPERPTAASLGIAAGLFALALAAYRHIGRAQDPRAAPGPLAPIALLACCALPFLQARPLEIGLLELLRNLGLVLAAMSRRPPFGELSALVSLFLALIAAALAEGMIPSLLLAAYAVAGCAWLMLAHWRRLRLPSAGDRPGRLPLASLGLSGTAIAAIVLLAIAGPSRAATVLAGLVPSSGGTSWSDPDARGGVDDGDNEVKGSEKPESIGFAESEAYLDTDRPSLYDAFNDMYGEPSKPKQRDRMVAIGNENVMEQGERPAENLRAGRQFALVRRGPDQRRRRPGDREAKALLDLKGRAPVHLGLAAYEHFDGRDWQEQPRRNRDFPLILEGGEGPWLRLDQPSPPVFGGTASHQLKIGSLDSGPLPAPAHTFRFRVGRVNQPDFFGWSHEGMLRMSTRTIPSGTVIETEARIIDRRLLDGLDFQPISPPPDAPDRAGEGYRVDPAVMELAKSWTAGTPRGWGEVEAVVSGLRGFAAHDRRAAVPEGCDDAVADFLLRSRRGPDFQFATAAAAILRELGYRTRLVTGLYARPERYDPRTRHTPVIAEDVHAWAEVWLPNGAWATIEPTPGYEVLGPAPSWSERVLALLADALRLGRENRAALAIAAVLATIIAWRRHAVIDWIETAAWRIGLGRDPRRGLLGTLRLVERRLHRAGRPRPAGTTPRRWLGPVASRDPGLSADMERLLSLAEWSLYAPPGSSGPPEDAGGDPRETCRRVVAGCTPRRLRHLAAAHEGMTCP